MKILKSINLDDLLFIDIETVRANEQLEKETPEYSSWEYKMRYSSESGKFGDDPIEKIYASKAALYAEFGKIVCITIGRVNQGKVQLKSYYNASEKDLLLEFNEGVNALLSANKNLTLSGFAIKGFDIPYIMRRCLVNRIDLSPLFDVAHLKPWELKVIDVKDLWQGTGWYSASLVNVTTALGLPSPKSVINGSETSDVYYKEGEKGLEEIKNYCERDVSAVINIVLVLRGDEPIELSDKPIKPKNVGIMDKLFAGGKLNAKENTHIVKAIKKTDSKEKEIAEELLRIVTDKK